MKTLLIVSHPQVNQSASQSFFKEAVQGEEGILWHPLDQVLGQRPDGKFDVEAERALVLEADRVIFQFPLYWYQVPALLKDWMDQVLSLEDLQKPGLELGVVVTLGVKEAAYQAGGKEGFTISELLRPLQACARALGWTYLPPMAVHQFSYLSDHAKQILLMDYLAYLTQVGQGIEAKETWLLQRLDRMRQVPEPQRTAWQLILDGLQDLIDQRQDLAAILKEMKGEDHGGY